MLPKVKIGGLIEIFMRILDWSEVTCLKPHQGLKPWRGC